MLLALVKSHQCDLKMCPFHRAQKWPFPCAENKQCNTIEIREKVLGKQGQESSKAESMKSGLIAKGGNMVMVDTHTLEVCGNCGRIKRNGIWRNERLTGDEARSFCSAKGILMIPNGGICPRCETKGSREFSLGYDVTVFADFPGSQLSLSL